MSMLSSQAPNREYASRPADERFPSVDAIVKDALQEKDRCVEKGYNLKDLKVVAASTHNTENFGATPDQATLKLQSPKGTGRFTHWSFGQLCRTVGAPASYLRSLPPAVAADALNFGLGETPAGTQANLLVRMPNGNPEPIIRACTSDKYGRLWDAELYGSVQKQIMSHDDRWQTPPTWSGEPAGAYRGDRDSFLILVNGGSIVKDPSLMNAAPAAGISGGGNAGPADGMYRGILIRNSEVGASAVTIETILFRYICGNHMLWGAIMDRQFRRRHIGSNVLRDTVSEIGKIAFNWTRAGSQKDEAIIRDLIEKEIAHTKEGVIDELRAIGFNKEQAEGAYSRCEQTESASPRSYWGIAQGATRISQDAGFNDERYTLDRLAGQILARGVARVKVAG